MKHPITIAIAGLGLCASSSLLLAQQQQQPPRPPPGMQQTQASEPEVRQFAEIYVERLRTQALVLQS